ncbi:hypothetical protein TUM20983_29960 [Mycobacterium antarcticum]|nr:hypothetical protein TUM20983_29960 [Mycolicibacterium sp. TUM20983]
MRIIVEGTGTDDLDPALDQHQNGVLVGVEQLAYVITLNRHDRGVPSPSTAKQQLATASCSSTGSADRAPTPSRKYVGAHRTTHPAGEPHIDRDNTRPNCSSRCI